MHTPVDVQPFNGSFREVESAVVGWARIEVVVDCEAEIERTDADLSVITWVQRDVRKPIDRGREHRAWELLVPSGHVGATARKADSQGRFGADNVALEFFAWLQRAVLQIQKSIRHCGIFLGAEFDTP